MVHESFQTMKPESVKYQYLAAVVVNVMILCNGIILGWSSPSIHLLTSDESPLPTGKITMNEASWVASLMDIGSVIGGIFFGFIAIKFSRKLILIALAIPVIVSWSLILVAQNVYYLYVARILHGIVFSGVALTANFFIIEITADRVRGFLISSLNLIMVAGIEIAFTLGTFCDFTTMPKFVMALTVLFVVLFYFFPESPIFHAKQNKISAAERSIRFYRNISEKDYDSLKSEVEKLMASVGDAKTTKPKASSLNWVDFVTPPGRKAMIIGFAIATISQFCGPAPMMAYTANIFRESGSTFTPNMSAIVVGSVQLSGSCIGTGLIKQIRRKLMLVSSLVGMATGQIALGTYTMLKLWNYDVAAYNWIPLASFSFVQFIASCGILALYCVIVAEVMPLQIKEIGMSVSLLSVLLSQFISIKFFPFLTEIIGFHGCMFLFAITCLLGAIFIITYIPETKGKSYDEIMNMLK